jgi:hypothetical protein
MESVRPILAEYLSEIPQTIAEQFNFVARAISVTNS